MFRKFFTLFSAVFFFTFNLAAAEEDLFLGEIENPNPSKRHASSWGLMLEASFSDSTRGLADDASTEEDVTSAGLSFTVSKLFGQLEPFVSFEYRHLENAHPFQDRVTETKTLAISSGLIFNITSRKKQFVPFLSGELGYSSEDETVEFNIPSKDTERTADGIFWAIGGGLKVFLTEKRNVALVGSMVYTNTNVTLDIDRDGVRIDSEDYDASGISSGLGLLVYL